MYRHPLLRPVVTVSAILTLVLGNLLLATGAPTPTAAAATMVHVRLLHAVPGAGAVDVYIDGTRVFGNASYRDVSNYELLATGIHKVVLYPGNTDLYSGGAVPKPLWATYISVPSSHQWWTMAVVDRGAELGFAWFADDVSVPQTGMARVRFVNLSPGTPAIDTEAQGAGNLTSGISYLHASPFSLVSPGVMSVLIHPAGWDSLVAARLSNYNFQSGHIYTFYLIGRLTGGPGLQVLDDVIATQAMVRLIHAAPGVGGVDAYIQGVRDFGNATYGDVSDYTPVPANAQQMLFYPPNPDVAIPKGHQVLAAAVNFTPDMTYTLAVVWQSGKLATLALPDDTSLPDTGKAKLRVIDLSSDASAIDVSLGSLGTQFTDVTNATATDYSQFKPGTYAAALHPTGMTSMMGQTTSLTLEVGHDYTLFIMGKTKGAPALQAMLVQDV